MPFDLNYGLTEMSIFRLLNLVKLQLRSESESIQAV